MKLVGEQIPDYVQYQIKTRQTTYGKGSLPGSLRDDEALTYQNSNNAFIKMASGVSVNGNKLREIGIQSDLTGSLSGMGLAKKYVLFGGTAEMSKTPSGEGLLLQTSNFISGSNASYKVSTDWGIVPMPGIESLDVKSLNRGSLKKATVKLTAQNREQLAILDVLYMRLGYTVLIEWGNSIYMSSKIEKEVNNEGKPTGRQFYKGPEGLQQMYTSIIEDNNGFFNISWSANKSHNDIIGRIVKAREDYQGNFDALFGKVSNFNWSFNPDGSYSIELTVISLGDVVESLKTNVAANNDVISYVEEQDTSWTTENDSLDQHRTDNVILSLLHVFRLVNLNPKGDWVTIGTEQYESGASGPTTPKPTAYLGKLLVSGSATNTIFENTISSTFTIGFKKSGSSDYIQSSDLTFGYYGGNGAVLTAAEAQAFLDDPNSSFSKTKINPATGKNYNLDDFKGWGYGIYTDSFTNATGRSVTTYSTKRASIVFANNYASLQVIDTSPKFTNQTEWNDYKQKQADPAIGNKIENLNNAIPTNPAVQFRYNFSQKYKDIKFTQEFTKPDGGKRNAYYLVQGIFAETWGGNTNNGQRLLDIVENDTSINPNRKLVNFDRNLSSKDNSKVIGEFPNPLIKIGYEANDAFVLNLDKPQYYIRFGLLLDLLQQKVITRINTNQGAGNYTKNPNLFNIDFTPDNNLMLCLPLQISFDWRTCIVRRKDFDRKGSFKQSVLPELEMWAFSEEQSSANTAFIPNIYLNFNFIADTMSSAMDERRNVSVYDFIKGLCDGINRAMAGVNNLEPVIDEDTNTLRILDSSPIPVIKPTPDYSLQLYGYGNGSPSPKDSSTFVRKVDLKTAITPEYATMVTVGATANGYVKGIEATAFARWNDGLTDRFKTKLLAADPDTKSDDNSREDTTKSFLTSMRWSSRSFGIEGKGTIWETFPPPSAPATVTHATRITNNLIETLKNLTPVDHIMLSYPGPVIDD
jgi:hypothetical protein